MTSDGNEVDRSVRVKVQFNEWEQARLAYDTLHKKQLFVQRNNDLNLQCWLPDQLQYSIKIKIPQQQYEVQKRQWDELSEKKPGRDAHVHTKVADQGVVFIKVVGKDKTATGSMKVRIEGMVAGEKLDPTTHWHPSFASKTARAVFHSLAETMGVYVRNDFVSQSVWGPQQDRRREKNHQRPSRPSREHGDHCGIGQRLYTRFHALWIGKIEGTSGR